MRVFFFSLEVHMNLEIRPGRESDKPEMLRLWREMMDYHARLEPRFRPSPPPQGEQAWEKFMNADVWGNEDCCIFVAEADGQLVGQIIGTLREQYPVFQPERYGYVSDIVVDPSQRRSGIGRALFEALKNWFRKREADHLELSVAHNNPASQAFWRSVGCSDYRDTLWYDLEEK
jgi:ribosomal protein S18 acetylase RimI-like enzyme